MSALSFDPSDHSSSFPTGQDLYEDSASWNQY